VTARAFEEEHALVCRHRVDRRRATRGAGQLDLEISHLDMMDRRPSPVPARAQAPSHIGRFVRFDSQSPPREDGNVMLRGLRTRRPVAAAMMFAVVAMLSATCLAAESMTPAEKACCAAMTHDCGEMAISEGCCTAPAQEGTSLFATSRVEMPAPALPPLVAILDVPEPLGLDAAGIATSTSTTPVKPPGTSTYLIVSSFRL
jgi:hypothetical protein